MKYLCTFMNSKIVIFVTYIEINSAPIKHRDGEENRRYSKKIVKIRPISTIFIIKGNIKLLC